MSIQPLVHILLRIHGQLCCESNSTPHLSVQYAVMLAMPCRVADELNRTFFFRSLSMACICRETEDTTDMPECYSTSAWMSLYYYCLCDWNGIFWFHAKQQWTARCSRFNLSVWLDVRVVKLIRPPTGYEGGTIQLLRHLTTVAMMEKNKLKSDQWDRRESWSSTCFSICLALMECKFVIQDFSTIKKKRFRLPCHQIQWPSEWMVALTSNIGLAAVKSANREECENNGKMPKSVWDRTEWSIPIKHSRNLINLAKNLPERQKQGIIA